MKQDYLKPVDWKTFLIPYSKAVEELKVKIKAIRKEYRDLGEYSPIEFVTGRVKKISSIVEKAKRRGIPISDVAESIDDIAGIRIMCQFTDDIYKVVELIRSREDIDLTIIYEKDYVKYGKKSGYKSYHIIIKHPVQTIFGPKNVFAEIQIRTLAMNFWATIEHSINYKYRDNIPDGIQERLVNAALAAEELDKEMQKIRNEVIGAQLLFEIKSTLIYEINQSLMYISSKLSEDDALLFKHRFDLLWESQDIEELNEFLDVLKTYILNHSLD